MQDERKTKKQLVRELRILHAKLKRLEKSEEKRMRLADELRESEERYHSVVDNSDDAILLTAPDGSVFSANPAACRMFDRTEKEICRLGRNGFVDKTDPRLPEGLKERERTGRFRGELTLMRRDGRPFPAEVTSSVFRDRAGHRRTSMLIRDLSEPKRAEEALRESEERFRRLYEGAPLGYQSLDAEGCFIDVNQAWLDLLGYSRDEVVGHWFGDFLAPQEVNAFKERFSRFKATGEVHVDLEMVQRAGSKIIVHIDGKIGHDEHGHFRQTHCILHNITEHKRAEETLRASEERYRRLFEGDLAGNYVSTPAGKLIACNAAFARIFRFKSIDDALATNVHELYPNTESRQVFLQSLRQNRRLELREAWLKRRDGTDLHVIENTFAVFDDKGELIEIQGYLFDDTERKRAEEALRLEKENFRHSLDESPLGVRIVTADGDTLYANRAILDLYGYDSLEELQKTPLRARYTPESYAEFQKRKQQRQRGDFSNSEYEISIVRKNGEVLHLQVHRKAVLWNNAQQFLVMYQDITERKRAELASRRAEKAVRESEEQYRSLVEAAPDVIYTLSAEDGSLTSLNPAFERLTGWSRADWLGKPFMGIVHPDDLSTAVETFQKALRGEAPPLYQLRILSKSGEYLVGEFTTTPLVKSGKVMGELGIARDITERKRAEEALAESERKLRTLFEILPVGVSILNAERKIVYVNPALERILDISRESLFEGDYRSRTYLRPNGTLMPAEEFASVRAIKERRAVHNVETGVVKEDGTVIWTAVNAVPLGFPDWAVLVVTSDITERKRAEEAAKKSEEYFKAVIENALDITVVVNKKGVIKYVSPSVERHLGYTQEELIGKSGFSIIQPMDLARGIADFGKAVFKKDSAILNSFRLRHKDGSERVLEGFGNNLFDNPAVAGFVLNVRDVTERRQAEMQIQFQANLLANVSDAILATDRQFKIQYWNTAAQKQYGWTSAEVLGRHFMKFIQPQYIGVSRKTVLQEIVQKGFWSGELLHNRSDGTLFHVHVTISEVRNAEGEIIGHVAINRDVTERKRAEERLLASQEQLHMLARHLQSVREEERKHLSQEFHDQLGQVLTALKMDLSMLHRTIADPGKELSRTAIALDVESMQGMIDRAIGIIREIMSELRPEMLDQLGIVPTLEWEVDRFRRQSGISCTFRSSVEEIALEPKKAIALYRIFQEAITNVARHAKATSVEVALRKENGDFVLEIKDDGVGISADAEQAAQFFGVIGMRERAILLGGSLEIRGVEGKGTTVLVRIPYEQTLAGGGAVL